MDYNIKIIHMIKSIHNETFLKMIYGFVRKLYQEDTGDIQTLDELQNVNES